MIESKSRPVRIAAGIAALATLLTVVAGVPVLMAAIWKHSFLACEKEAFPVEQYLATSIDIFLRGVAATPGAPEVLDA